jgi:hypothetical protein
MQEEQRHLRETGQGSMLIIIFKFKNNNRTFLECSAAIFFRCNYTMFSFRKKETISLPEPPAPEYAE